MDAEQRKNIIGKVKSLLAIARDERNDEESQSAFLLAQKLMIKYKLERYEVEDFVEAEPIGEKNVTVFKRLYWWEKELADIIATNFRVKSFWQSRYVSSEDVQRKSCIKFYGLESDLELAKEIFLLAYEALIYFSKKYIEEFFEGGLTAKYKTSYIQGFLHGLKQRFAEQVEEMVRNNHEVMVITTLPMVVADAWKKEDVKPEKLKIPSIDVLLAYEAGYEDGKSTDFTRQRIGSN